MSRCQATVRLAIVALVAAHAIVLATQFSVVCTRVGVGIVAHRTFRLKIR